MAGPAVSAEIAKSKSGQSACGGPATHGGPTASGTLGARAAARGGATPGGGAQSNATASVEVQATERCGVSCHRTERKLIQFNTYKKCESKEANNTKIKIRVD